MTEKTNQQKSLHELIEIIGYNDRNSREFFARLQETVTRLSFRETYDEVKTGVDKNIRMYTNFTRDYGEDIYNYLLENRKNVEQVKLAQKIYDVGKELVNNQLLYDKDNHVEYTLKLFGLADTYNKGMFKLDGKNAANLLELSDKKFSGTSAFTNERPLLYFDGIDFGMPTRDRCLFLENVFDKNSIYTKQYNGARNELANDLNNVTEDRLYSTTARHGKIATTMARQIMNGNGDKHLAVVNLSNGVFFGRCVTNQIVKSLNRTHKKENVNEALLNLHTMNVGVRPLWHSNNEMAKNFPPEISIYCANDIFAPISGVVQSINLDFANKKMEDPVTVFTDPQNDNRVCIYLGPGMVHDKITINGKDRANVGCHQLEHYLASFGLVDGTPAKTPEMAEIGEKIIKPYINGEMKLTKTDSLKTKIEELGIGTKPLNKKDYAGKYTLGDRETGNLLYAAEIAKQIASEYIARGDGRHAILDNYDRMKSGNSLTRN